MRGELTTIRTVGATLPPDLLERLVSPDAGLPGLGATAYRLVAGETPRNAAHRAWSYLRHAWLAFDMEVSRRPEGDPAIGLTRDKWLQFLFRELGYGRVAPTVAGGIIVGDRAYPVSHLWQHVPIHQLGWHVDLDKRTKGVPGAADRAPHAMVQELLNRTDDHLWAILTNGRLLRLLRDATNLTGVSFVEFDLETMFRYEIFSDFVLLFLLVHESRFEVAAGESPSGSLIETWRTSARDTGVRARGLIKDGVKEAIEQLGTGFLAHPANGELRERLARGQISGGMTAGELYRELLRLVYRILFLFVAEDRPQRDLLLDTGVTPVQRERWLSFYSTATLRRRARTLHRNSHGDEWHRVWAIVHRLGRDGVPELGMPPLRGLFAPAPGELLCTAATVEVGAAAPAPRLALANTHLLAAIRALSVIRPKGQPERLVDFARLGAEELGGIYEQLLELVPRVDPVTRTVTLESVAGNDRKTTGSYYTPTSLIDLVLDEALDPLLDEAEQAADPEGALLALTVCDPACGSGHFLVAAAHRIADRVASVRARATDRLGDVTPDLLEAAMRDVVVQVIHGVDIQPMAAELAKVSLWLESMERGKPLAFLDHRIKVGNSLLGATPALLARGVPDKAYAVLTGDDRQVAAVLKTRNTQERLGSQGSLFDVSGVAETDDLTPRLARLHAVEGQRSIAEVEAAEARFRELEHDLALERARREADAWCAAFTAPKADPQAGLTTSTVAQARAGTLGAAMTRVIDEQARAHGFFHWHLEFPEVFAAKPAGEIGTDESTGWRGGFAVMIGNPPWETLQMSEKEFFEQRDPAVAGAANASARKRAIAALKLDKPALHAEFLRASRAGETANLFIRASGRYPLTARGKINTYSIFAELFRTSVAWSGRMGIITPTGLATDATTAAFFADTVSSQRLVAFYDFENEAKIFEGVHNQFRFAVTAISGGRALERVQLAFYTRYVADTASRRFALAPDEVAVLNPNTKTLPIFRTRRDAEITLAIYRRFPVLIEEASGRNPWGLSFTQGLFNMASDSGLFVTEKDFVGDGATFDGWAWRRGDDTWLPLYEAKMLGHYDHRFSTYRDATQAQLNKGTLPRLGEATHDDPAMEPLARYWIAEGDVADALTDRHGTPCWDRHWLLGWRGIGRASDSRTFIPAVAPVTAISGKFPVAFVQHGPVWSLQANWTAFVFDFVVRQKLAGTDLAFFIVKQLACPPPEAFDEPLAGVSDTAYGEWIRPRVLELTYTSWRIAAYANDVLGLEADADPGPPFRWLPPRREQLRAELDAAMFQLYGLARKDVEHVMDSFAVVRRYEERDHGEFRSKRLILAIWDEMAAAAARGRTWSSPLNPAPGHGPRHDAHPVSVR